MTGCTHGWCVQLCDRSTPGSPEMWSQHLTPSVAWVPQVLVMTESPAQSDKPHPGSVFGPCFSPAKPRFCYSSISDQSPLCPNPRCHSQAGASGSVNSLLTSASVATLKVVRMASGEVWKVPGIESSRDGTRTCFFPICSPNHTFFAQGIRTENRLRIQPSNLQKLSLKFVSNCCN